MLNTSLRAFWVRKSVAYLKKPMLNFTSVAAVDNVENLQGKPKNSKLVAEVFDSLKEDANDDLEPVGKNHFKMSTIVDTPSEIKRNIVERINSATDVSSLLSIAGKGLSRSDSLKIISILAEWTSTNKIKISDFENDPRFINICQFLGRQTKNNTKNFIFELSDDLNTVLGVTGDDEAARIITSLNIPQMVKVMSILAQKKRRSTPLLRALSYNITRHAEVIDLKKCADLLYAMALLNFPDPVLIDRICSDVQESLSKNDCKSSVIASIATSLGILKYKDVKILNALVEWASTHQSTCRSQDLTSLIVTLGTLGHQPSTELNIQKFTLSDFAKPTLYLDYVWSLLALNTITVQNITDVLSPDFVNNLRVDEEVPFSSLKKLCNINGYANTLKEYKGPFLAKSDIESLQITYSKEKNQYVNVLLETLKGLISSDHNIKKSCNSNMGFLYDAEILLDARCNPYPVQSDATAKNKKLFKVALFALEYHDMCRNSDEPTGSITLYRRLLENEGFKVVYVPYTEFNVREKLMHRVQYLDKKLKDTVSS